MKFENLEALLDDNGNVTVGRMGPIRCAAVASDDDQMLAALVRPPRESLSQLLRRLDAALPRAWETEECIDEINGP